MMNDIFRINYKIDLLRLEKWEMTPLYKERESLIGKFLTDEINIYYIVKVYPEGLGCFKIEAEHSFLKIEENLISFDHLWMFETISISEVEESLTNPNLKYISDIIKLLIKGDKENYD